ncbi:1831_t:CDS:1, partial [Dentiscutata heterogama]
GFCQITDSVLNDIVNALETFNLPDSMQVDKFLEISDKNMSIKFL